MNWLNDVLCRPIFYRNLSGQNNTIGSVKFYIYFVNKVANRLKYGSICQKS